MVRTYGGAVSFRHPLVRAAVYQSAGPGRRQQVHAALADALAGDHRSDRALWHRAMSTDTTSEELAAALEASAREARRRGGPASAASAFERAASLSEERSGSRSRRSAGWACRLGRSGLEPS